MAEAVAVVGQIVVGVVAVVGVGCLILGGLAGWALMREWWS